MIVIDTSVLVYAVGEDHPLRDPARRVMTSLRDGRIQARTSAEVIQEFAHVRARRRDRADARTLASAALVLLRPLISIEEKHVEAGLELWENIPELGSFDAILAAAAIDLSAELISADKAFGHVPMLDWVNLASV